MEKQRKVTSYLTIANAKRIKQMKHVYLKVKLIHTNTYTQKQTSSYIQTHMRKSKLVYVEVKY